MRKLKEFTDAVAYLIMIFSLLFVLILKCIERNEEKNLKKYIKL